MPGLVRRLVARLSGLAVPAPAGSGGGVGQLPPFLARRAREAEEALRGVVVPGYDVDVVSSGVVVKLRVSRDGSGVMVFIDYYGRNPGCSFCRFISDTLWAKIFREMVEALRRASFERVVIVEAYTGALLHDTAAGEGGREATR